MGSIEECGHRGTSNKATAGPTPSDK